MQQGFSNFEVLIVDGNSSDDTLNIVAGISSGTARSIRVISEPDKGIYDAMNKGIEMANGEWLYFLGSDDKLFDNEVLNQVHQQLSKSRCKVAYGNVKVIGNNRWAKDGQVYGGRFHLYDILRRNICHQAIFYQRDFLKQHRIQYDLRYPVSADWDLNLKCWELTRFCYLDILVAYFDSGGFSSLQVTDGYANLIPEKFPGWVGRYRTGKWSNAMVRTLLPLKELIKNSGKKRL